MFLIKNLFDDFSKTKYWSLIKFCFEIITYFIKDYKIFFKKLNKWRECFIHVLNVFVRIFSIHSKKNVEISKNIWNITHKDKITFIRNILCIFPFLVYIFKL